MADPMIYTSPDTVQRDWRYGSDLGQQALVGQRNTNRWSPLANALMGIAGGMHRNFARGAEASNTSMETGAMQAATGAGSNMAAAQALMQSGVPALQKHGLNLMAQARNQASSDARSDKRLAIEQQRYNDGSAMRDVQLETARVNLERLRRGDRQALSEFEQRRQQAQAVGLDPATREWKIYLLSGELPDSMTKASAAGEKLTEGQRNTAGFANMMETASKIVDELEKPESGYNPAGHSKRYNWFNGWDTDEHQRYKAAAATWIRAKLRKESGAAIGEKEMEDEFATFFPQPGDGKQVIEQKRKMREEAQRTISAQSGGAYEQLFSNGEQNVGGDDVVEVRTAEERARLAPGTRYRAPDGSVRVAR